MAAVHATSSVPNDNNLETYSLIWLEPSRTDIKDHIDTQKQLHRLINNVTIFNDVDACEQHVRLVPEEDRIILVADGHLAQEVISRFHSLHQIFSIYVYNMEKKQNEEWINKFRKVNEYITTQQKLIFDYQI